VAAERRVLRLPQAEQMLPHRPPPLVVAAGVEAPLSQRAPLQLRLGQPVL
jgi:hypothetical protein